MGTMIHWSTCPWNSSWTSNTFTFTWKVKKYIFQVSLNYVKRPHKIFFVPKWIVKEGIHFCCINSDSCFFAIDYHQNNLKKRFERRGQCQIKVNHNLLWKRHSSVPSSLHTFGRKPLTLIYFPRKKFQPLLDQHLQL